MTACTRFTLDVIRANDFNMNIPRYVAPVVEEETLTVEQAYSAEEYLESLLVRTGLMQPSQEGGASAN